MSYFRFCIFLLLSGLFSCNENEELVSAGTEIYSTDPSSSSVVIGTLRATYIEPNVTLTISLINQLPGAIRAVHLHTGTCEEPGDHWNMDTIENFCDYGSDQMKWGKPYAGDIGNILINADGTGSFELSTDLWSIATGLSTDMLNKLVIVHAGPTNFFDECDPNHIPDHPHTNTKIGCGTIL